MDDLNLLDNIFTSHLPTSDDFGVQYSASDTLDDYGYIRAGATSHGFCIIF